MEILTFITCCDDLGAISKADIVQNFHLTEAKLNKVLKQLYDQSLIEQDEKGCYFAQEWVLVPFAKDFEPVNDAIFSRAYNQFQRSEASERIRHVVTVRLTQPQRNELEARLRALINWAAQEGNSRSKNAMPYTFGTFASPRIFGDAD